MSLGDVFVTSLHLFTIHFGSFRVDLLPEKASLPKARPQHPPQRGWRLPGLEDENGAEKETLQRCNSLTSGDDVVRGTLRAQALKNIWTPSGRLRMRAKMKIHDNSADVFLFSDGFFRDLQDAESRSFFVILNTRYCALQLFSLSNCGVVIREFGQFDLKLLLSMCRAIW